MRGIYDEITAEGADVVAIGTGDVRYAQAFVDDEQVPFLVLVDDDGDAAAAAEVKGGASTMLKLASPSVLRGSRRAMKAGHRQHKAGKRSTQLGATFVVGPGETVVYEHLDGDVTDHAPLSEVMAAVRA